MSNKRMLLTMFAAGAVLLALVFGSQLAGARPPAQSPAPPGATIPYSGRLSLASPRDASQTDEAGQPVADGVYDFTFTLYDVENGGEPLWTETQEGVAVQGGAFTAMLGRVAPLPQEVLEGGSRWLEVGVRGPGETEFTLLSPRQELSAAPAGGAALTNGLSCAHTHWGETWTGSGNGLSLVSSDGDGVVGRSTATSGELYGVYGRSDSTGGMGVFGRAAATSGTNYGVYGRSDSTSGRGVYGTAPYQGVYGYATADGSNGVYGKSDGASGNGVLGSAAATAGYGAGVCGVSYSPDGDGVFARNDSGGTGLHAYSNGSTRDRATIRAHNPNTNHGMAAYLKNNSDYATAHFYNGGTGEVLYLQNGGTDAAGTNGGYFIKALNEPENDVQFSVLTSGEVRSDVGFNTPASDFAEMLSAVEGLEPGDVLVVGVDGKLARSTEAYQATVVGVYSTQPGFVGGQPVEGELEGHIPLAVVGVVPVKASAENGPIRPGDLLVASSTPGHAMKAGPNPAVGTVIGKALQGLESGTGLIRMLVMLQ